MQQAAHQCGAVYADNHYVKNIYIKNGLPTGSI